MDEDQPDERADHPSWRSSVRPAVVAQDRRLRAEAQIIAFPAMAPATDQQKGRDYERAQARQRKQRLTPASGAGRIKGDAIDADGAVFEYKHTSRASFSVKEQLLIDTLRHAEAQGVEAHFVLYFEHADITLEGRIHRGKR